MSLTDKSYPGDRFHKARFWLCEKDSWGILSVSFRNEKKLNREVVVKKLKNYESFS